MKKKTTVVAPKAEVEEAPVPVPVVETPAFITRKELEGLVQQINDKFARTDATLQNINFRFETFLKIMCQFDTVSSSSFVEGLRKFQTFSAKIEELKRVSKLSERIKQAIAYNESASIKNDFVVLADDIDILKDVANAELISKENVDMLKKLASTDLFWKLISKFEPKA